ncbi:MAG TPA: preprotein translocase subunit SecE [Anaerolineaceae bacterium]|nr:preprotein translocase subunit SecE [Anaerolineaceae bacterium]
MVKTKETTPEKPVQPVAAKPKPVEKRASKSDKPDKPNRIKQWWHETMGELRKVSWPTRPQAFRLTWIVVVTMLIMSAILGGLDYIFSILITALVKL